MFEDRPLELLKWLTRLEAELVEECPASILILLERFRLAARPVEGDHQLCSEPLTKGMALHERSQLGHRVPRRGRGRALRRCAPRA